MYYPAQLETKGIFVSKIVVNSTDNHFVGGCLEYNLNTSIVCIFIYLVNNKVFFMHIVNLPMWLMVLNILWEQPCLHISTPTEDGTNLYVFGARV